MDRLDRAMSDEALLEADRRLVHLEDVCLEADGSIPPWVVAARAAVQQQLRESHAIDG